MSRLCATVGNIVWFGVCAVVCYVVVCYGVFVHVFVTVRACACACVCMVVFGYVWFCVVVYCSVRLWVVLCGSL